MTTISLSDPKLNLLTEIAANHIELILNDLDVKYSKSKKKYVGCCPVHGGDNAAAWNLYPDGEYTKCFWKCRTHQCQLKYKPTIFGLVRGIYEYNNRKVLSFPKSVDYICNLLKIDFDKLKVDKSAVGKKDFYRQVNELSKRLKINDTKISREKVRESLTIPASYYLKRGYNKDILDRYDVGLCETSGKDMFNRIVVPVYDENYKYFIGCTGRSILEKCRCGYYHAGSCPITPLDKYKAAKWRNNKNFAKESCLYNFWFAKEKIKETSTVILVEGPGDVWKLEEAGITNSVAKLGSELSEEQLIILECSGAMNIIDLSDNDEAGEISRAQLRERCSRLFNLSFPKFNYHDIGEMTVKQIETELKSQLI